MIDALDAIAFRIGDSSGAAEARRRVVQLASRLGFGEAAAGAAAIVVTELATNLWKHAGGEELIVQPRLAGRRRGLDLVSVDRGPGIASVRAAMRDGYSTAGSAGTGLGALSRLAEGLDVHTAPGAGTVIAARLWAEPRPRGERAARLEAVGFSVALAGEVECGDAWAGLHLTGGARFLVADGLGHGADAAKASHRAIELFEERPADTPGAAIERLHAGLRPTRGAAAAVVEIDLERERVCFAGVGNVAGAVVTAGAARSMVSHNGTLGHDARKIAEFTYPFGRDALLVLHSDGLSSRWSLDAYPGLAARQPGVIAGVLYRDFRRERDDATIVVARASRAAAA